MYLHRDSRITKIALIVFFSLIGVYALFEAQGLLFGPTIAITSQVDVAHQPFITIRGRADHITTLSMNGRAISVTEDGVFQEPYVLSPGLNHITFDASDKYGRTKRRVLEVVYTPTDTPLTDTLNALDPHATTSSRSSL